MEQYLPITGYGVNAFDRWTSLQAMAIMRDIDYVCSVTGLSFIPQPLNYYICSSTFCIVVGYFYYLIFACLSREDDSKLNYEDADGPSKDRSTKQD